MYGEDRGSNTIVLSCAQRVEVIVEVGVPFDPKG